MLYIPLTNNLISITIYAPLPLEHEAIFFYIWAQT